MRPGDPSTFPCPKRDLSHSRSIFERRSVTLLQNSRSAADPGPALLVTRARLPGEKENDVVLADLLLIVPATLAGIGGVLLGDRAGLWIKTALAGRQRD